MTKPRSARPRVVVMGASDDDSPPGLETLRDRARVSFAETRKHLALEIVDADALFAWQPDGELLRHAWARARRLRWVQSASAGVDSLLFPALVKSDVVLTNARGVFDEAVAEYVLGLMLAFAKDFPRTFRLSREGVWEHRVTESLAGRRLLMVGVGPIGRAIARVAQAVGMDVHGVGRTARSADPDLGDIAPVSELAGLLPQADYVVDALPATPGTRHLFDRAAFAAMRSNARFVNVGRGATVDESALTEALRSGRIAGAALDVFEDEPLPRASPLWGMPNVIVSPHISGDVEGWERAVVDLFLDNFARFVADGPLRNVVDKRLGYVAGP